jgi:hypothetical protein
MRTLRTKNVHILMTPEEADELFDYANSLRCSAAHVVRELVRAAVDMTHSANPRCATGAPCFVPHMHASPNPAPMPPAFKTAASPPGKEPSPDG